MSAYVLTPTERPLSPVPRTRGAYMAVLIGPDDGAPNFAKRRFVLEPGGRIPAHWHPDVEHEQVVMRGEMVVGLDDDVATVRAGDVVFIPAKTVHWYENRSHETCEFLCTVPITERYETEWVEPAPDGAFE